MIPPLPKSWVPVVGEELDKPYFQKLREFVEAEQEKHTVYPPEDEIFTALDLTPYNQVRVLLLGQDPYPGEGQAHGLAFSVKPGVKPPASLRNMFKELGEEYGYPVPKKNGSLVPWAEQGVLLLNTVLTVRAGEPLSHRGKGWEKFTDAIITAVGHKKDPVVFILWGGHAQKKLPLIDVKRHKVVTAAHPSPLSAKAGFFGSDTFIKVNKALDEVGKPQVNWKIEDE